MEIRSICVFCASSSKIDDLYFDAAAELGQVLARQGVLCVCGAGNQGLMGVLADSVLLHGGSVRGVIPRFMYEKGWGHQQLTEVVVVETIHERKSLMSKDVDAVVALPGGCGTIEELMEIITWKQLGLFEKPIVILNTNGYYNHLLRMLDEAIGQQFMRESHRLLWRVVEHPNEVLSAISNTELIEVGFLLPDNN